MNKRVIFFPVPGYEGNKLWQPCKNEWHKPPVALKALLESEGFTVESYPDLSTPPDRAEDFGLFFDVPQSSPAFDRSLCVFLEPPVVKPRQYERINGWPYTRILTYALDFVDDKRIFHLHYPIVRYTKPIIGDHSKYICAITSNLNFPDVTLNGKLIQGLYGARRQAYLSWGKNLDLYGDARWAQDLEMMNTVNYCGPCEDKTQVLSQYKYAVVFENCELPGWTSEKFWDAVQAKTIPLYRGWWPKGLSLDDVCEEAWSKNILKHIKEVVG